MLRCHALITLFRRHNMMSPCLPLPYAHCEPLTPSPLPSMPVALLILLLVRSVNTPACHPYARPKRRPCRRAMRNGILPGCDSWMWMPLRCCCCGCWFAMASWPSSSSTSSSSFCSRRVESELVVGGLNCHTDPYSFLAVKPSEMRACTNSGQGISPPDQGVRSACGRL